MREVQISLPSWGTLNDHELDAFFAETCGRFGDVQFLHYKLGRSRRILTGDDYARLVARHRNLVAIKMSDDTNALRSVALSVPSVRCFLTELGFSTLADETGCGLLCALSVSAPTLGQRLFAASSAERALLEPTFRAIHAAVKNGVAGQAHMDGA